MIPFNRPYITGTEIENINKAHEYGQLAGDGFFTKSCHSWLEKNLEVQKSLLTHSCTAALEMCAILLDIQKGDEVIMPSYTFVSTANAFVLRGACPIFVDINPSTLCIDEYLAEEAITAKTKAIVVVHYAGVSCNLDRVAEISRKYNIPIVEDAAQAITSTYKGRYLGSVGDLATLSFHETKNIISGEGGALLINNKAFIERAEIIREKGTNRSKFTRGQVDKYSWVDIGSSFLPGELISAFLYAQLTHSEGIIERRMDIWNRYQKGFENIERMGFARRPIIPPYSDHNAHMYYLILNSEVVRNEFIARMRNECSIQCVFHYIPLHSSSSGDKYSKSHGRLDVTDTISKCLVRLPLWIGVEKYQEFIIESSIKILLSLEHESSH